MGKYTVAAIVLIVVVALLFLAVAIGWSARRRRQSGLPALAVPPATTGEPSYDEEALYIVTTRADEPTDRIAVHGLGVRAHAVVTVVPEGIVLGLAGRPDAFIPRDALVGVGHATWTIDRVVGRDRLAFVRWRLGDLEVDSYFRPTDPAALVAAIETLVPAPKGAE